MQNEEFKRVWEKEGRRLFAIEKQKAADQHKVVTAQQKGVVKTAPKEVAIAPKHGHRHASVPRRKGKAFKEIW